MNNGVTVAREKKTDAELLAEAQAEKQVSDLRLMGASWREIESETGINYETARRIYAKYQTRIVKGYAAFKMERHIAEELARYDRLIREAWQGWIRSVGRMKESVKDSGSTHLGSFDKKKIKKWIEAGNPEFIKTIDTLMEKRNRLVGAYDKDRDKDNDKVGKVIFEQRVYIPGLGELTQEMMLQLILDIEKRDYGDGSNSEKK